MPSTRELLRYEPDSGLYILPAIFARDDPRIASGLSAETLQSMVRNSSDQRFEYVVIDLPPIGPLVTARGLASIVDGFIFVVEWGATFRGAARAILEKERPIREKLLGVILNKVNMKKLNVYEHPHSDDYYYQKFEKYYKDHR